MMDNMRSPKKSTQMTCPVKPIIGKVLDKEDQYPCPPGKRYGGDSKILIKINKDGKNHDLTDQS